ncbi:MAG: hypothetical protein WC877_01645 [Dehalococcoidales bacterium]|jgi:hypothetical protein
MTTNVQYIYNESTASWIPVVQGGINGTNGKTWLNGSGAPSNSIGVDGDFYIDTTNHVIYGPKSTAWPVGISLIINYTSGDGIDITNDVISVDFIDESGKVFATALPSSITGAVSYHGSFDPTSGAPSPAATGYYYVSSGVGTISSISFATGDWLVYRDASSWDKIGNSSANVSWANVSDKPSTFTPAAHTQSISTITNLQSALDGKLGTSDTAANSTLWASLAMPSVSNATALQVMRLNSDKSALEFATISGSLNITGLTTETSIADDDYVAIYDTSASANRKMTKANFVAGLSAGSIATDTIWDAAGDLVVGTGSNTASRLPMGTALQQLRVNSEATGLEFATITSTASTIIQRSLEGVVYETSLMYWVAPATCTISTAIMALSSNPSASSTYCKVQVMKNGILETNSIFTSDTPIQITEVTSATNGIYQASGTLDSGQTSLAAGDVLHFRVNQADTGSADLLVQVKVNFT